MHTQPQSSPENAPLDIIAQEARNVALSFGLGCAGDMAMALIERLLRRFEGQRIYIPSKAVLEAKTRNRQIRAQFTGNNLADLASNHRLSKRQVRNILVQRDAGPDRPRAQV